VKSGVRALGVAESFVGRSDANARSTLCGAVTRADRQVDGLEFDTCTVGGTDATDTILTLYANLDREDVRYLLVAGIAPAWFNVVDLTRLHDELDRPVIDVTFEASAGLESALREHFSGEPLDARLDVFRRQPDRRPVEVNGERVFVRAVGVPAADAADVVRAFTPAGGRPEPVRVARMAARAAREWRERERID
jgi:hypothetical protein